MPRARKRSRGAPKKSGPPADRRRNVRRKIRRAPSVIVRPDGGGSWISAILEKSGQAPGSRSAQDDGSYGEIEHPFDLDTLLRFKSANDHHSACIDAKVNATVGLGFESDRVAEVLDPLCELTFQDEFCPVGEDWFQIGGAFLEVVRADEPLTGEISGLHWAPAKDVRLVKERPQGDDPPGSHWVMNSGGRYSGKRRRFAHFGDATFTERVRGMRGDLGITDDNLERPTELIYFRRRSSLHRYYGWPDWVSAVAAAEVVSQVLQHNHDFFHNGAVPELVILLLGSLLDPDDFDDFLEQIQGTQGMGKAHQTVVANFPNKELQVVIEKLTAEMKDGFFSGMLDTLGGLIVTAHRVPHQIAGIPVPGKLGSSSELAEAAKVFQALVVGPVQNSLQDHLACTLGVPEKAPNIGLSRDDFKLRSILDEMSLDEDPSQVEAPGNRTRGGTLSDEERAAGALDDGDVRTLRKSMSPTERGELIAGLAMAAMNGSRR